MGYKNILIIETNIQKMLHYLFQLTELKCDGDEIQIHLTVNPFHCHIMMLPL